MMSPTYPGLSFTKADGSYNTLYYPHLQILGPATGNSAVDFPSGILGTTRTGRLRDAFQRGLKNPQPDGFKRILAALTIDADKLWTAWDMHGAEYERGGFNAYAASRLAENKMVATAAQVKVNMAILPRSAMFKFTKREDALLPLDQALAREGIAVPAEITAEVWIIAPEKKLQTAIDMIEKLAARAQEADSHRGFGFNEAVARQYTGTQNADPKRCATGWFEIFQGIFVTIDANQFARWATAMNPTIQSAVLPPLPAATPGRKR